MKSEPNRSEPNVSRTLGLGYFNLARGLGMVLIVLGHYSFPEPAVCSEAGSWRHFS